MSKKCAVFSCVGLGDGLLSLILSNNLQRNGCLVDTFHPFLSGLQRWFPYLPILPFPNPEELLKYDQIFCFYETLPKMQEILDFCRAHCPEKLHILNPIATKNHDYPYWEEGRFEGHRCMVDNLYHYVTHVLNLSETTRNNGIVIPEGIVPRKFPKRLIIHPLSSRPGKNWPKQKFVQLAKELSLCGYEPFFALMPHEQAFDEKLSTLTSLDALATVVAESGIMMGNDSGIGHLASCLGLPTVTICRNRSTGPFWRPGWAPNRLITPPFWVPNIKGYRLRDKQWQRFISVRRVKRALLSLQERAGHI